MGRYRHFFQEVTYLVKPPIALPECGKKSRDAPDA